MGGLKTFIFGSVIWATAASAQTLPWSPSERVQRFAECAGRYSALADHQSFFDGAASEAAKRTQKLFEDLLDATLPDAMDWGMPGEQALTWRVGAKMATAAWLHSQSFANDERRAERSQAAAEQALAACDRLIGV